MKIALLGFGKMGHIIKDVSLKVGHTVTATIDTAAPDATIKIKPNDKEGLENAIKKAAPDGIIEFSNPSCVLFNIKTLLPLGVPLVVGTTGWSKNEKEIQDLAQKTGGVIMHSSNFCIGVNLFYKIVEAASKIMAQTTEYDVATWEMHHNQKADSPSGTALQIANIIMQNIKQKTQMITDAFDKKPLENQLHVSSTRCGATPGTHSVFFDSGADTIELTHRARNREGFALGAVRSLERLVEKIQDGTLQKGRLYCWNDLF